MINKIRLWIIKNLLKDTDGYTFTGFGQDGVPLKFYYSKDNDTYYLGLRSGTMYYARPTLTGWSLEMSRYLPWGKTIEDLTYMSEPKEIDFKRWIFGVLENINNQYRDKVDGN